MTEDPRPSRPRRRSTTAARVLLEMKIGSLPVRDGDEIVGILTLADALESLLWFAQGAAR